MHILDINEVKQLYSAGKSLIQIGKFLGVSQQTIKRRLLNEGVGLRRYTSNQFGSDNHKWKGGTSRSTVLKATKQILLEAGTNLKKCQMCGFESSLDDLDKHHINEDRSNNNLNNLMVLCSSCHSKQHTKKTDELGRFTNGKDNSQWRR